MTYFVIGFIGRVGSSYLEGLLNSHPDVQCEGEILSEWQMKNTQDSCRERLDRLVHGSDKSASGFKLALAHVQAHPDIADIMREHEYRVIHLTRRNRVDQYISMRLAQLNGIWRSDAGTYEIHSFSADPQQLNASVQSFKQNDLRLLDLLSGLPFITVTYEDLIADTWRDEILPVLGVRHGEMESPFSRQRCATRQRDALENYDALARHFEGTDLQSYFVE